MSRNICFFQVLILHVLGFVSICDLFTDSPWYKYEYIPVDILLHLFECVSIFRTYSMYSRKQNDLYASQCQKHAFRGLPHHDVRMMTDE
jgi:hypothetical protein